MCVATVSWSGKVLRHIYMHACVCCRIYAKSESSPIGVPVACLTLNVSTSVVYHNISYWLDASMIQSPGQALQFLLGPILGGQVV